MYTRRYLLPALLSLSALAACPMDNPLEENPFPPNTPESYVVKGRVLDAQGSPLAGAQIFARNTFCYNCNVIGVSDAQGYYRIELPREVGSYLTSAQLTREYHGRRYSFRLHIDNNDPYAGVQGAVRNFEWRLTGATHEGHAQGGLVWVYAGDWAPISPSRVELTLTPDGPLVDGSAGQVVVRMAQGGHIEDIAVGRYKITARYLPPGETPRAIKLRVRYTEEYLDEVTAMFPATPEGSLRELELEVHE